MGTELNVIQEETLWNDEVVAENDALIEMIENDIAKMKADLHRLSEKDEQDDILLM